MTDLGTVLNPENTSLDLYCNSVNCNIFNCNNINCINLNSTNINNTDNITTRNLIIRNENDPQPVLINKNGNNLNINIFNGGVVCNRAFFVGDNIVQTSFSSVVLPTASTYRIGQQVYLRRSPPILIISDGNNWRDCLGNIIL